MRPRFPSFRGIEAFLAVLETGSIRGAAVALHLTGSAVSHRIQQFESDVGSALFARHRQRVVPTAAARRLHEELQPVLTELAQVIARAGSTTEGKRLRIATLPIFYSNWLTPRLDRFLTAHPDAQFELLTIGTPEAADVDITLRPIFDADSRRGEQKLFGWDVTPICHPDLVARHHVVCRVEGGVYLSPPRPDENDVTRAFREWLLTEAAISA